MTHSRFNMPDTLTLICQIASLEYCGHYSFNVPHTLTVITLNPTASNPCIRKINNIAEYATYK